MNYLERDEEMLNDRGMSVITVDKKELLETLQKNLAEHSREAHEAKAGYRKAVVKELESMLADAREGKRFRTVIDLVEPVDHSRDYARVLKMLEMSVAAEVTITENEFSKYVMDDWSWKADFKAIATSYLAHR